MADARTSLGILLLQTGRPADAESECRNSRAIFARIVSDNHTAKSYGHYFASALVDLGDVVRLKGQAGEAKNLYQQAIGLTEPRVQAGSQNVLLRQALMFSIRRRGLAFRDLGDFTAAAADARRSLELSRGLPPLPICEFETACCHAALAGLAGRTGSGVSPAEGEAEAAKAIELLGRAVAMGYRNANEIRIESAFDSIRNRPDFSKLLGETEPSRPPK